MSFFGKFKPGLAPSGQLARTPSKRDPNAPQPSALEKHLATLTGPPRTDGSDKFFGFENYGSTCYCNSIIQCLYYSESFREHVVNFPSKAFLDDLLAKQPNGHPSPPPWASTTPYPNPTSPARKQNAPTIAGPGPMKPEENKDSPEYRKKMALQTGPVLGMTSDNSSTYGMDESLFTSMRDIFEAIVGHSSRTGVVSPHRFLEILRRENEMFRSAMHQDAHEFLNLLLNQVVDNVELFARQQREHAQANGGTVDSKTENHVLHIEGNGAVTAPVPALDTHWIHDLFEGLLTSETKCLTCETASQRDEAFLDLSVDLDPHTSVTSCLRRFSKEEMLCERNKFHCDNCGGLQEAEKRMKIKRLPHILALHLKRFKYTEDLQRLQKLFHRVVYPFFLRLFNTTDDAEDSERIYELYAVVVHIGGGPYHGHYVSIIKTKDRGWLLFDDELVEPVPKSYVENFFGGEPIPGLQDAKQLACAYVLFYQTTTEEAMDEELEAEGQPAVSRLSDAETAKEGFSPVKTENELQQIATFATPNVDDMDQMESLVHYKTAPGVLSPSAAQSPSEHPITPPHFPGVPPKSKKELKQEEKERRAREKEEKKAESKALEAKRRALAAQRMEAFRRQNDELTAAMEASKQSATEDARKRGEEVPMSSLSSSLPKDGHGLARFRTGSMSIRGRPRFFSKDKDREKGDGGDGTNGGTLSATTTASTGDEDPPASPAMPAPVAGLKEEEKGKKNRFSLGRKKPSLTML